MQICSIWISHKILKDLYNNSRLWIIKAYYSLWSLSDIHCSCKRWSVFYGHFGWLVSVAFQNTCTRTTFQMLTTILTAVSDERGTALKIRICLWFWFVDANASFRNSSFLRLLLPSFTPAIKCVCVKTWKLSFECFNYTPS